VPYISAEILRRIEKAIEKTKSEITIVEIGGTVGEYQNAMFIEAARILKLKNPNDVLFVLVSYLPVPGKLGEMKTKPTQYAVRAMNSYGVHPDIIVARSEQPIDKSRKEKIAFSSNIPTDRIISAPDISSIYEIPINFEKDKLSDTLLKLLRLRPRQTDLKEWKAMFERVTSAKEEVRIGIVGKYFKSGDFVLKDVYISIIESLKHAAGSLGKKIEIDWLDSEDYEGETGQKNLTGLKKYHGILVPGGFGGRGIEGKINVIEFVRENKIPYFGICYGMQLAVIEYARHKAGLKGAHTTEIDPKAKYPVIAIMEDQKAKIKEGNMGGSMRLGAYPAHLKTGTLAREAYGQAEITERHRHRFEVNPEYLAQIEEAGLVFSGTSPDRRLMEIAELPKKVHPFFVGAQFHPEFKSSPLNPHPLFKAFVQAAIARVKPVRR
jgi:CTP synthase